jgi:hypothetical protein
MGGLIVNPKMQLKRIRAKIARAKWNLEILKEVEQVIIRDMKRGKRNAKAKT